MSVSDGAFSVLGGSLAHFRTIRLYVCLVVNGTSTFITNVPSGTAARVLTSGHPPETITRVLTSGHSPEISKHDIVGWKACKPFRYSSDGNRGEAVEDKICITS